MFLFGMFWVLLMGNMFFADHVYRIEKEYVGLSARETNDEGPVTVTVDGEQGGSYEFEASDYLDPIIKDFVVNKNSTDYEKIRSALEKNNEYVQEEKYEYWQTAVVDGFYSRKTTNSIEKGFYYFLELCHKTVPTLIFILILNFIVQIFTRFEYSLLRAIYHPTDY
ncbi:hypothetical protein [Flavivirga spongiicola]|uniref:Uncharacterized protein n=1 Tax=Flavivirga spongiicola TaxID=421621 RepID=A0ABU7XTP5_9FLAO|nr:hypothetical protein [Flavivirga sp. MEBiC05379]MDO5978946.1 hypothetical protein [Flavivirga sp. MEBiC05379]